jgi:trehalose 6-phosphate phosphatase
VTQDHVELPARAALLLDLDGTLIDFAPTPEAVVVPPSLLASLRALRERFGGAVAIVSGRPVEQVEELLGDAVHVVVGEHGAAARYASGAALERPDLPELPAAWLEQAARAVAAHRGAFLERKAHGFVLHYRLAPEAGPALHAALEAILGDVPGPFAIMTGSMVWELRPTGVDKGGAVHRLMARAPFAGRVPVYIGDDVTDEDGMRAATELGGLGLRVQDRFGNAAGVRAWLAKMSR